jgi:hypothetical protein
MHSPIYRCHSNCGGISSIEEFAAGALTNFLDSMPAGELANRKAECFLLADA